MTGINQYWQVYRLKFSNAFAQLMSFRINFVLTVLVDIAHFATVFLTVQFLFNHVERIGPWGKNEFMFFICFIQSMDFIHSGMVAPNFWNFSDKLKTGKLDFRLLRPIGSLFDTFTAIMRPTSLCLVFLPLGVLIYYGIKLQLSWLSWVLLPVLFVQSFILVILIELSIALGMFWTIQGDGVNFVRLQTQRLKKWPDFIYQPIFRKFFTFFIPLLAVGSYPVQFLLNNSLWPGVLMLTLAIVVFWFLVSRIWALGLARYDSASS